MNAIAQHEVIRRVEDYPTPPTLAYGQEVNDRFQIHTQIGYGGQARIYGATDWDNGNSTAIKVPAIPDEEGYTRFEREIEVATALSGESDDIVEVVDSGVSDDYDHPFMFIAMERMDGGSLDKRIWEARKATGTLAVGDVIKALTPAFRGVAVAHAAELVHRDIKPGNVFLNAQGYGKLGDFGIVASESYEPEVLRKYHISPEIMADNLTHPDLKIGSPGNMAPEVVLGQMGHTKAADYFACGVTLHHALTGKHPILGQSDLSYVRQMETFRAPKMSQYPHPIPKSLGELSMCLMEREPQYRPTVSEAVRILEDAAKIYC